jgi:PTS system beta-glucosides-specific IIC component
MFGFNKKTIVIMSPMEGVVVPVSQVSDPVFSADVLGKGVAVKPTSGVVYAPSDAEIDLMFDTGHAVSLKLDGGVDLLIHVGLDTVKLKGRHFVKHKENGDKIRLGEELIGFDAESIVSEGFDSITPVIVCNPDNFRKISFASEGPIRSGDPLIFIEC